MLRREPRRCGRHAVTVARVAQRDSGGGERTRRIDAPIGTKDSCTLSSGTKPGMERRTPRTRSERRRCAARARGRRRPCSRRAASERARRARDRRRGCARDSASRRPGSVLSAEHAHVEAAIGTVERGTAEDGRALILERALGREEARAALALGRRPRRALCRRRRRDASRRRRCSRGT